MKNIEKLDTFKDIKPGWCHDGGEEIKPECIQAAKDFLAEAWAVPCINGGVALEWARDDLEMEIVFGPDGRTEIFINTNIKTRLLKKKES